MNRSCMFTYANLVSPAHTWTQRDSSVATGGTAEIILPLLRMAISLHFSYSDFCKCFCECSLRSFSCWSWGFWITWNFGFAYHSVYLRHCPVDTLSCCSLWWYWSSSWSCRSLRSFRCCFHCCLSCIGCCRLCSLIPSSVSEHFWERLTCCSEKISAESYCHSSTLPDSHRHRIHTMQVQSWGEKQ